jgi:outer membrane protein
MNKALWITLLILMFALPVAAQKVGVVGVVDVQKVLVSVKDGQSAKSKLDQKVKKKKAELEKRQKDLQTMQESLRQKMALVAPQEKQKKMQEYQQKVAELQNEYLKIQQELQQEEAKLMQPILLKIQAVTAKVAKKYHLKLVVEKSAVVYMAPSIDITNEVIRVYNK